MDDASLLWFNSKAMNKMEKALHELNEMDDLAAMDSPIHHLSPLAKLLTTIAYIIITVSFHKYDLSGLMIMVLWPILLFSMTGIPVRTCFYKLRIVLPLEIAGTTPVQNTSHCGSTARPCRLPHQSAYARFHSDGTIE